MVQTAFVTNKTSRQAGALSCQQITSYTSDGFVEVAGVLDSATVAGIRTECRRLWGEVEVAKSNPRLQWRRRLDGSEVADRIDPVVDISPVLEQLTRHSAITGPVAELLGCPAPELFKAKLISKWPGTRGYDMHQDYSYWLALDGAGPNDFITVLLALDRFDQVSGTVEMFPGLHHGTLPGPSDNPIDVDERTMDLSRGVAPVLEPGDLLLFHGQTPHRSGPNMSAHNRECLFITYTRQGLGHLREKFYTLRPVDFLSMQ